MRFPQTRRIIGRLPQYVLIFALWRVESCWKNVFICLVSYLKLLAVVWKSFAKQYNVFSILFKQSICVSANTAICLSKPHACCGNNSAKSLWGDVWLCPKSPGVLTAVCRSHWLYFFCAMVLLSGRKSPAVFHLPNWDLNWTKGDIWWHSSLPHHLISLQRVKFFSGLKLPLQFPVFHKHEFYHQQSWLQNTNFSLL